MRISGGTAISANPGSNVNVWMPGTRSPPSPEKILCILCIHVNKPLPHAWLAKQSGRAPGPRWLRERDEAHPGVPPAQQRQGLAQLLHPGRPANAVPAGGWTGDRGETERHRMGMRAGRPRSRVGASSNRSCSPREHTPACRSGPCRCGRAVPLRAQSCQIVPPPPWGADHAKLGFEDEPPMDTNERE